MGPRGLAAVLTTGTSLSLLGGLRSLLFILIRTIVSLSGRIISRTLSCSFVACPLLLPTVPDCPMKTVLNVFVGEVSWGEEFGLQRLQMRVVSTLPVQFSIRLVIIFGSGEPVPRHILNMPPQYIPFYITLAPVIAYDELIHAKMLLGFRGKTDIPHHILPLLSRGSELAWCCECAGAFRRHGEGSGGCQ